LTLKAAFIRDNISDKTIINKMHHDAHAEGFIANAVLTVIITEPVL
jgi:hypothetical protein